jgi:glycosyltransferase involved in cell wall biosynthesis
VRVAIVVQRYGLEVGGGSETLARRVAELLFGSVEVTVVTTCALDYQTWTNDYPVGATEINGVRVLRFPVSEPRQARTFERACAAAYAAPDDPELGRAWARAQGPTVPELVEHLRESDYDVVAFVTYLYGTTIQALPAVAERSLLVPTVHDEPPLRLRLFDELFRLPRLFLFSTPEERDLAHRRFGIEEERSLVVGVGVDEPPPGDPGRLRATAKVKRRYVACVGRLDASKGVDALFEYHRELRRSNGAGPDLVLVGNGPLRLPRARWLHRLGFVPEQLKHDTLAGAEVVVCPSPYESLSFSQLEAWSHGRPTLSNASAPVLVAQSRRSGGGIWYADGAEYAEMLTYLDRNQPLAEALGRQGRRYVRSAYAWSDVRDRWLSALERVAASP